MSPLAPAAHLSADIDIKFRFALTLLWTGSHYIPIETDAWRYIERDGRICNLCKDDVSDEFYFLFTCTTLNDLRETFIDNVPVPPSANLLNNMLYFDSIAKITLHAMRRFCV